MDGMRHATIFTMRNEPQVIQIREAGIEVVQNNCVRCHTNLITDSKLLNYTQVADHARKDRLCWSMPPGGSTWQGKQHFKCT